MLPLAFALVLAATPDAPDPLRLIPKSAGLAFKLEHPRRSVETALALDVYQSLKPFPAVRELFDSTPYRRFYQQVAFLEAQLGKPWPELLDALAGGGVALGVTLGRDPAPAVLVVRGTDTTCVTRAFALLVAAIEGEAGKDAGPQVTKKAIGDVPTISVGKDAHLARVGSAVVFANTAAGLAAALDLAAGKGESVLAHKSLAAARTLAGPDAAAWGWLDFAAVKATPAGKDFFDTTRSDLLQTLVIGGTVDALRRSDFVAFRVAQSKGGASFAVRLPAKRPEPDVVTKLHVPPAGPGSLPLLTPPGTVYSQSFYLDVAHWWAARKELLSADNLRDLEKGESDVSKLIPGTTIGKLLASVRPYHRVVVAHTGETLYKTLPGQGIPPAAVVVGMKDGESAKSLLAVLRAGAFLAGFQTGWAMKEKEIDGVSVVTYRFPETGAPKFDDPDGLRFNAAPTACVVGTSLVVGSTPGIVAKLIPLLKAESTAGESPAVWRSTAFAAGGADLLLANLDPFVTQTVLTQGVTLADATAQVKALAGWLRAAGTVETRIEHAADRFEFVIDWRTGK